MKYVVFALALVACKSKTESAPEPTQPPSSTASGASAIPPPMEVDAPPPKDPNFGSAAPGIGLASLPPPQIVVDDMKVFCAISPGDSKTALAEWTKQMQTKTEVAELWANAVQGDALSQTRLRAAADAAAGAGKCNAMLDTMFGPGKQPPP